MIERALLRCVRRNAELDEEARYGAEKGQVLKEAALCHIHDAPHPRRRGPWPELDDELAIANLHGRLALEHNAVLGVGRDEADEKNEKPAQHDAIKRST